MKKCKKIVCLCLTIIMMVSMIPVTPFEVQAATTFNVSTNKMKKSLDGYSIKVTVDEKEQRFIVKNKDISKFSVKSKKYSSNKEAMTVTATVYIDRSIATIKTTATMKYALKKKTWKLVSVKFGRTSISKVNLKGSWLGTYTASQGETKIELVIGNVSKDGYASGTLYFSATPTNPTVPSGYNLLDFYGYLDLANKKIKADDHSLLISNI